MLGMLSEGFMAAVVMWRASPEVEPCLNIIIDWKGQRPIEKLGYQKEFFFNQNCNLTLMDKGYVYSGDNYAIRAINQKYYPYFILNYSSGLLCMLKQNWCHI